MLTRNRAKLLNIEVANNIPLPERKRKVCQIHSPTHARMVSFVEDIEYIDYTPLYEVNIDFDEAHDAWVANKIKQKNGC